MEKDIYVAKLPGNPVLRALKISRNEAYNLTFQSAIRKNHRYRGMDGYTYSFNGRVYRDVDSLWLEQIEKIAENVQIGVDKFGEKVLRIRYSIPTFDSIDREWNSKAEEYLMFDGKDTWIKEHYPDLPMISLNEIRKEMKISPTDNQSKVLDTARERARELLRKKQPFVWNATNLSPMVRAKQIKLFTQYHASARIVYLETDWNEQLRHNTGRADAVPEQAICNMMEELILPEAKEAQRVEWFCV